MQFISDQNKVLNDGIYSNMTFHPLPQVPPQTTKDEGALKASPKPPLLKATLKAPLITKCTTGYLISPTPRNFEITFPSSPRNSFQLPPAQKTSEITHFTFGVY